MKAISKNSKNRNLPNFLVIGAAKAGTTSLHYYLDQHPQVYMSVVKEPRFFAFENQRLNFQNPDPGINVSTVTSLEKYYELFDGVTDEIAIGEASPIYLYSEQAPYTIKKYIPSVKLITVLRHPVERAYSCYTHLVREGYERLSFADALSEEESRISNNWAHLWHYTNGGFYYEQLKRYFEIFDSEQIKVYLYEDLCTDSGSFVRDMFNFLGVNGNFSPDLTRKNVSGTPRVRYLHYLFSQNNPIRSTLKPLFPQQFRENVARRVRKWNLLTKPSLQPKMKSRLVKHYHEDILKLQDLIQRDLSHWFV